jgi:hypothetical protein
MNWSTFFGTLLLARLYTLEYLNIILIINIWKAFTACKFHAPIYTVISIQSINFPDTLYRYRNIAFYPKMSIKIFRKSSNIHEIPIIRKIQRKTSLSTELRFSCPKIHGWDAWAKQSIPPANFREGKRRSVLRLKRSKTQKTSSRFFLSKNPTNTKCAFQKLNCLSRHWNNGISAETQSILSFYTHYKHFLSSTSLYSRDQKMTCESK